MHLAGRGEGVLDCVHCDKVVAIKVESLGFSSVWLGVEVARIRKGCSDVDIIGSSIDRAPVVHATESVESACDTAGVEIVLSF